MKKAQLLKSTRYIFICSLYIYLGIISAAAQQKEQALHALNKLLVNTVMTDLFTPPVASRIYAYPNIAFYECIRYDDPSLRSLSGKLNGLGHLPGLPAGKMDILMWHRALLVQNTNSATGAKYLQTPCYYTPIRPLQIIPSVMGKW